MAWTKSIPLLISGGTTWQVVPNGAAEFLGSAGHRVLFDTDWCGNARLVVNLLAPGDPGMELFLQYSRDGEATWISHLDGAVTFFALGASAGVKVQPWKSVGIDVRRFSPVVVRLMARLGNNSSPVFGNVFLEVC